MSKKSYVISACLAAVFGTLGIHHFYLGRWAHGVFDLSLLILGIYFLFVFAPLGYLLLLTDFIHTAYFTFKLIIGEYKDGNGDLVAIPSSN
ncbi:MAG: NINE protein [Dehalococcoidia bacterium]